MSKRLKITPIDFQFGIGQVIPSTREALRFAQPDIVVRKSESQQLEVFKDSVAKELARLRRSNNQFPTSHEVFVFILQYFVGQKEYRARDIDNMSKTILDLLKGKFYADDSQVRTLLVGKKIDQKISQDFAYVAVKEIRDGKDIDALKISGIERSVTMFQELKSQGLL